jgi:hypothetical protein
MKTATKKQIKDLSGHIVNLPQHPEYPFDIFKIGDGATELMHSDSKAGTVIKISPNGRRVWVQRDIVTLDPDFKPNIIPGGFCGHCTNQADQRYTYKADPEGSVKVFSLKKWRGRYVWTSGNPDGYMRLVLGRSEFYDYNF